MAEQPKPHQFSTAFRDEWWVTAHEIFEPVGDDNESSVGIAFELDDARRFAAAKELLEAAKFAESVLGCLPIDSRRFSVRTALQKLQAAISKAEDTNPVELPSQLSLRRQIAEADNEQEGDDDDSEE